MHIHNFGENNMKKKKATLHCLFHFILVIIFSFMAFTMLIPFLWMISTSFKPDNEVMRFPPKWFPKSPTLKSYQMVWQLVPFGRFFFNSVLIAVVVTASNLLFDSLAAYGFAKRKFPGMEILFVIILSTMMVPKQVTMVPLFTIMRSMPGGRNGWIDTYKGLIVPGLTGAYGVFLMRQFIKTIPKELEEAAKIDGYSSLNIFFTIIIPLSKTALLSLGVFTFLWGWNDFIWPLIITNKLVLRTLPLGIAYFQGQYLIRWNLIMAASTIATLPIALIYFIFQREFVNGIAMTGIKD
jgi:multiple sugar transport system permease protein